MSGFEFSERRAILQCDIFFCRNKHLVSRRIQRSAQRNVVQSGENFQRDHRILEFVLAFEKDRSDRIAVLHRGEACRQLGSYHIQVG